MATESVKTEVGSYFISNYPPYSQWNEESLPELRNTMNRPPSQVPLGLYMHIPFCRKRCKFCYFKVFTDNKASDIEQYVQALSREIELVSRLPVMGGRPFRFVYFGGGTPSFLSIKQLTSLVDRLRANINWDQAEEVTFECEPGTLQEAKIHTLKELGVTRLSLGVENFSDAILEENGRAHLSKEVYRAWDWIQAAQFPNVNIDLISGMVGETWDNWKENIRRVIQLSPESVTIYQMELPFNTVYSKDILGNQVETQVADWPTKRAWLSTTSTAPIRWSRIRQKSISVIAITSFRVLICWRRALPVSDISTESTIRISLSGKTTSVICLNKMNCRWVEPSSRRDINCSFGK
jgi:oxygen-independent coproporphyrinogen III oxidase